MFLIEPAVALLAILLWQFVATMLMRVFGVRLPLQPFGKERKRALQLLTFSQSVWCGFLFDGCGMWIAMTLFEYLSWKYGNGSYADFSLSVRLYAVLWPAFGLFIGFIKADDNRHRRRRIAAGPMELENATTLLRVNECFYGEISPVIGTLLCGRLCPQLTT
jgi:hypothetical protein